MKLATWNVNSLRVRLPHLLDWLAARSPDVVCLQETKCEDEGFPAAELGAAGYRSLHHGQRSYNGVAILSRMEATEARRGIPAFADEQSRVIAADVAGIRVVSVYVPNGQAPGCEKFAYKLRWFEALASWLAAELAAHPRLAVLGDFNVAPEDRDVHDPAMWEGKIHVSEPEREALARADDERDPRDRKAGDLLRAADQLLERGERHGAIEHPVGAQPLRALGRGALGGAEPAHGMASSHTTGAWSEGRSSRRGATSMVQDRHACASSGESRTWSMRSPMLRRNAAWR